MSIENGGNRYITKTLTVVYFGGRTALYLNNELLIDKSSLFNGEEELFSYLLDLIPQGISKVVKYGVSEESDFWDTVTYVGIDWQVPTELYSFEKYYTPIE